MQQFAISPVALYDATAYHVSQQVAMSAITVERVSRRTYTPKDIAEATGRHPESIRRNLREKDLRGTKMGNEWVVTEAALRDWLGDELFEIYFGNEA